MQVDLENLPESQEEKDDLVRRISLLKRNAMAAPFEQAFDEYAALHEEASKYTSESAPQGVREGGGVRAIHYRDEEAIYIKASHDRVTVIFSTVFREETDRVYGKVFLQEFVDARRRAIQNAPQVLFRNDPPLELEGQPGIKAGRGDVGYVTFGKKKELYARASVIILLPTNKKTMLKSSSPATSPQPAAKKSSRTSRPSATTSTTTSWPAKPTSTAACAGAPPTSCKCCVAQDLKLRKVPRRGRRRAAGRSRLVVKVNSCETGIGREV